MEHIFAVGLHNSQGVFFKPMLADFGWTRAMLSGAFAVASLLMGGLAPLTGALADRYGPRRFIAMQALSMMAGYILLSRVGALWQVYLIFILFLGLGRSAGMGSIIPTIPRWFEAKRGLSQGLVQAGGGLGTIILPPLVAYLILSRDWRFAFVVSGILVGMATLLAAWVYRRRPQDLGLLPDGKTASDLLDQSSSESKGHAASRVHPAGKALDLRQALTTRSLWQLFAVAATAGFSHQLITVHLVPHATDKGFSTATAAIFMSVLGIANMLGKLTMGVVSDYIGRQRALMICLGTAASLLLWLTVAEEMWAFYLFAAIYGFAYGGWMPLFPTFTADLFGVRSLGVIYGTVSAANAVGAASGVFLGGYVFDVTHSYVIAFVLAAAFLALGVGLLASLRRPREQVI